MDSTLTRSDRCPSCGSAIAPDQRYCIECGERRSAGGLRDALPPMAALATAAAPVATAAAQPRPLGWATPGSTLLAGIATLLVAMGVGVLIGRSGHATTPAARVSAPVQLVTVPSGTGGTSAAVRTATADAASPSTKTSTKHSKHKHSSARAATTALQKTAAKSGVKLPPPTASVGSKCQQGAKGCQGGKFTGNFFGN